MSTILDVLKIKDATGNWISIPGLKGEAGNGITSFTFNTDGTIVVVMDDGSQKTYSGLKTALETVDDLVIISETEPTSETNKIWVNSEDSGGVQVPTMEEFTTAINTVMRVFPEESISNMHVAAIEKGANNVPIIEAVVDIPLSQAGEGNPTPDNIRPITRFDAAMIKYSGYNLWDEKWEYGRYNSSGNKTNEGGVRSKNLIKVVPGSKIFIYVGRAISNDVRILEFNENKEVIYVSPWTNRNVEYTFRASTKYIAFYVTSGNYGGSYKGDISLNYPSTHQDYQKPGVLDIEFPQEAKPVCGGTLSYKEPNAWELTKTYDVISFPTSGWTKQEENTNTVRYSFYIPLIQNAEGVNLADIICSQYPAVADASDTVHILHRNKTIHVFVSKEDFPNVSAWESYLSNLETLPEVLFPLDSHIIYTINENSGISTMRGDNSVWTDKGDILNIKYREDIVLSLQNNGG